MSKQFTWLLDDSYARTKDGVKGAHLIKGATYSVSDFNDAVVAEWVRTGAAAYGDAKSKKKEDA